MPVFEYKTFVCDQATLQGHLTAYGLESWRLHTCEPVALIGPSGSGILQVLVVLDRVTVPEEEAATEDDAPEGIAMKG